MLLYDSVAIVTPTFISRRPLTLQPTNAIDQMKLEKKRERNRLAASKCRQRKLERISTLGKSKSIPTGIINENAIIFPRKAGERTSR